LIGLMTAEGDVHRPVNLGNPVESSIGALAEKVIEMTGSSSVIEYRPLPADDPVRRCPDITLARSRLKWEPKVPLEQGLERTIGYFQTMLSEGSHAALKSLRAASAR
jgi:UDP-glucuronate decarboxylase